MNYNDIEAPKFVDFGSNFDEDGEGDSWFSNDSVVINPDEDISFGDSFQVRAVRLRVCGQPDSLILRCVG